MKWLNKLLGINRKYRFSGEEYHIDDARYLKGKKVGVHFYDKSLKRKRLGFRKVLWKEIG